MTNKTDNRLYRTDYAWCFDNPTLAAATIDSLEDALQAAETKLAAIRDAFNKYDEDKGIKSFSLFLNELSKILNTTNAQPAQEEK